MIKQEWKSIFHQRWLKIVLLAIIAIPSLYACIFLGSMWDPYGQTENIPVAVVNHDKAVDYQNQTLNIGHDLVNNLQDNQSMDFQCTDEQQAQQGLKEGKYYMIITIPDDFSKNATTLLEEQPQKMILHYTTNPGSNYIASKMDDSAIEKIKEEVSQQVTKTYAQTIFQQVDVLTNGLQDAHEGTNQLSQGGQSLNDGSQVLSKNLQLLTNSTLTFQDGAVSLEKGLKDYIKGVMSVHQGVDTLKQGAGTFQNAVQPLTKGISQLNEGASTLSSGLQQYTDGTLQAYEGTKKLVSYHEDFNQGMSDLQKGTNQLIDAQQQFVKGTTQLSHSLQQQCSKEQQEEIQKVTDSNTTLKQASQFLSQLLSQENSRDLAIKWLSQTLSDEEIHTIVNGQDELETIMKTYSYQDLVTMITTQNQTAISQFQSGIKELNTVVNGGTLKDGSKTEGLLVGSQNIQGGLQQLGKSLETTLTVQLKDYMQGVEQVNVGLKTLCDQHEQLLDGTHALVQGLSSMQSQLPNLLTGIDQFQGGLSQLYDGTSELVSHQQDFINGAHQLSQGSSQIAAASQQLSQGSLTLKQGISRVQDGLQTLDQSLANGLEKINFTTNDATYQMIAAPIETSHQEISVVENNGHAMAPYMMSVALYVAAMAFTLMYPIRQGIQNASSSWKYWLSKATVMYSLSTIAAIVLVTSLRWICGFEPQQLMMTYVFAIVISAAFMSLVMLLSLTTGYIGEFLLLVFMIFNLGGSAGTYPLETSNAFFQAIHAFVPYTYSVNGLRTVISMADASVTNEIVIFIGIWLICSLLTLLYYRFKNKQDHHLIPQAFEKVNE